MTILNAALWGLVIASIVGVMVGGGRLAYSQFVGSGCQADPRATGLLYGSILLGIASGATNTAITAAMT